MLVESLTMRNLNDQNHSILGKLSYCKRFLRVEIIWPKKKANNSALTKNNLLSKKKSDNILNFLNDSDLQTEMGLKLKKKFQSCI